MEDANTFLLYYEKMRIEKMKKDKLPTYLKKQKLLYLKETPAEVLINLGNQFFEQARFMDALDFYHKCHNTEGLQRIRQVAMEQGDFFLFQKLIEMQGENPPPATWEKLGEQAMSLGKYLFALKAFEIAKNDIMAKKVRELIK